jgi:putative MATE family efflux protein
MDALARLAGAIAAGLERAGVIDAERLEATVDLAWPRTVTGFAIMSKQAVDLAIVGIAVGSTAVAGLAFAGAYWGVAKFLGIGLAGGTVGLVSQNYGGGESERASLVVKGSVWLALALSVPIAAGYALFAEPLVALLGSDPDAVGFGATYLLFVAPGVVFEFLNLIASRTYAGVGDTFTPMCMRAGGAVLNVAASAALVFGAGMGVAGAALGTTLSTGVVCLLLAWGASGREYGVPGVGASPVPLDREGPWVDAGLTRQLLTVSAPLMARRVAEGLVVFPLLWIAASFGPVVVAALEVGRRVRALVNSFSWGFSIAASTLVGQRLGAGEENEAEEYGAAIIRLSAVVYVGVVVAVIALARPIATPFVSDPGALDAATAFVRVGAISAVALGIDGSATGVLRGAGDTRWPFLASLLGRYGFALPVAALGTVTPLGVAGLYLALLLEALVPGVVNLWRVRTNRWKAVSRAYRPPAEPDAG